MSPEDLPFPLFGYHLDDSDPDIVVLRRQDGSVVAAFSARGVTRRGIIETAKEDYRELLRTPPGSAKRVGQGALQRLRS